MFAMTDPSKPVPEISADEASRLVEAGALILDVREDDEWAAGHAPNAVHIPMGALADRVGEIPVGPVVVCVCRAGGRSSAVAAALVDLGFAVRNLTGGMQAWEANGHPVSTATGGTGQVI